MDGETQQPNAEATASNVSPLEYKSIARANTTPRRKQGGEYGRHLDLQRAYTQDGFPTYLIVQFETNDNGKTWEKGQPRINMGLRARGEMTLALLKEMRDEANKANDGKTVVAYEGAVAVLEARQVAARESGANGRLAAQVTGLERKIAEQGGLLSKIAEGLGISVKAE